MGQGSPGKPRNRHLPSILLTPRAIRHLGGQCPSGLPVCYPAAVLDLPAPWLAAQSPPSSPSCGLPRVVTPAPGGLLGRGCPEWCSHARKTDSDHGILDTALRATVPVSLPAPGPVLRARVVIPLNSCSCLRARVVTPTTLDVPGPNTSSPPLRTGNPGPL